MEKAIRFLRTLSPTARPSTKAPVRRSPSAKALPPAKAPVRRSPLGRLLDRTFGCGKYIDELDEFRKTVMESVPSEVSEEVQKEQMAILQDIDNLAVTRLPRWRNCKSFDGERGRIKRRIAKLKGLYKCSLEQAKSEPECSKSPPRVI